MHDSKTLNDTGFTHACFFNFYLHTSILFWSKSSALQFQNIALTYFYFVIVSEYVKKHGELDGKKEKEKQKVYIWERERECQPKKHIIW